MRVFLDASILFSAAKTDGAIRALLRLLVEQRHVCCADDYVVIEARRNLARKGAESVEVLDQLLPHLEVGASTAHGSIRSTLIDWLPEKDRPVLASALRMRCDALLTGDRSDFGAGYGKHFGGVTIHSPRSLLEMLDLRP
jgi:predicted nucleic acid-binding protein